jgi:hypothetical protein
MKDSLSSSYQQQIEQSNPGFSNDNNSPDHGEDWRKNNQLLKPRHQRFETQIQIIKEEGDCLSKEGH